MTQSTFFTRKAALIVVGLALVAGVGGWYGLSDSGSAANLTELDATSFARLRDDFNAAAGNVRVIVLLSPS